jgi:hypothetical protein
MGDLLQPWHLIVLECVFVFFVLFLIPAIFYLLTLQKVLAKCSPASRTMQPGMVWLSLIPLFNLIWNFFVVMGVANSLGNEFARRGIPSPEALPGKSIGLAMCICVACGIVPLLGALASLAAFVLWIIYWIKIANYSGMLGELQPAIMTPPISQ